jgi:hypothetical protein
MKSVGLVASECASDDSGEAPVTLLILLALRLAPGNAGRVPPGVARWFFKPNPRAIIGIVDGIDSYSRQLTRQIYKPKPFFGVIGALAEAS